MLKGTSDALSDAGTQTARSPGNPTERQWDAPVLRLLAVGKS